MSHLVKIMIKKHSGGFLTVFSWGFPSPITELCGSDVTTSDVVPFCTYIYLYKSSSNENYDSIRIALREPNMIESLSKAILEHSLITFSEPISISCWSIRLNLVLKELTELFLKLGTVTLFQGGGARGGFWRWRGRGWGGGAASGACEYLGF